MAIADGNGLPVAIHIYCVSPDEAKLVQETIYQRFLNKNPRRLIGDKAYDCAKLDE